MAIRPIVSFGDPRLRLKGDTVTRFDKQLARLIDDMVETMRDAPGVGLAAQQVGVPLQVCVIEVDGRLYEVVNPQIVHRSDEQDEGWEGCLSLSGYRALRTRPMRAVMTGQDRRGRHVRVAGSGLLARAIQHEYDHLQGELYVDGLAPGTEIVSEMELEHRLGDESDGEDVARPSE